MSEVVHIFESDEGGIMTALTQTTTFAPPLLRAGTPVRLAHAADPLGQACPRLGGARIPHGLEDPRAPRQVRENDCGIDTHTGLYSVAIAG
jgi:hypothetical protein